MPRTDASDIVKQRRLAAIVNGSLGSAGIAAKGPSPGGYLAGASRMGSILSLFTPAQKAVAIAAALMVIHYERSFTLPLNFSNYVPTVLPDNITAMGVKAFVFRNDGYMYCLDAYHQAISKIDSSGNVTMFKDLHGLGVPFTFSTYISAMCQDPGNNNFYVAAGGCIVKIDKNGVITPLILNYDGVSLGRLSFITGLVMNSSGILYASDSGIKTDASDDWMPVAKIDTNGNVSRWGWSTYEDKLLFNYPQGIALDSQENVYVSSVNIVKIDKLGNSTIFAKNFSGYSRRVLQFANGICSDPEDNIYVADGFCIAKIDKLGNVSIVDNTTVINDTTAYNSVNVVAIDSSRNLYSTNSARLIRKTLY